MDDKQIQWCDKKIAQINNQIDSRENMSDSDWEKVVDTVSELIKKTKGNKEVQQYFIEKLFVPIDLRTKGEVLK